MAFLQIFSSTFLVTLLFLLLSDQINAQDEFRSPCPSLFVYEAKSDEPDRWYGVITLLSESDVSGILLQVIFDKPALQLGNWFSEVESNDNKEYLFNNPNFKLKAYVPYKIRFFLQYNPSEPAPKLISLTLNSKTMCPDGGVSDGNGNDVGGVRPDGGDADLNAICGTIVPQPRPLITYGEPTRVGEFPWHAALYHAKAINPVYHCGASLVSKYYVITTAHCVMRKSSKVLLSAKKLIVYLGQYKLKELSSHGIQEINVAEVIPHPQFNEQTYGNNIALLKLATPADFTDYVRPVCLWQDSSDLTTVLDKQGTVVGWGFDETGKVTEQLMQAKMPVVSRETCITSALEFYLQFSPGNTYCAGFRNGTAVCNGDSGGGMVFKKTGSTPNRPVWQLRGLVSISLASQNEFKCDTTKYVVFTDTAKYLDWIKKTIEKN